MNTLDILKYINTENKLEAKININDHEFNISFNGCYYIYVQDILRHFNIDKKDFLKVTKNMQKDVMLKKIDNLDNINKQDIILSVSEDSIKTLKKKTNKYLNLIKDQQQFIYCTDIVFFKELSQEELNQIQDQSKLVVMRSVIDKTNKWLEIKYLSEVISKCCDYMSTHLSNELSYLLYNKYSLSEAKDKSYDIDSKYLVFLKQDLIQFPETKDLSVPETLEKYKDLIKSKVVTDPKMIKKLRFIIKCKGPISKCVVMSPVILPSENIDHHQEFNLTEHNLKINDIRTLFNITTKTNSFNCNQELWNKIISYDYSSFAKPKKEAKDKAEKPKKIKSEKVEKIKEEPEELVVEEKKPKRSGVKPKTEAKQKKEPKKSKVIEKQPSSEPTEAEILNSINTDTSVFEVADIRGDFNLE